MVSSHRKARFDPAAVPARPDSTEPVYCGACVTGKRVVLRRAELTTSTPAPRTRAVPIALALLGLAIAPAALADGQFSGSLGATTNYILRGVSQTYGGGAVQLGGSYQNSQGWFLGAWGSNVDPYPSGVASVELDLYAGYAHAFSPDVTGRIVFTRYTYVDDPRRFRYDYNEIAATLAYVDRLALTVSYSPENTAYSKLGFAQDKPTAAIEATSRWPIVGRLAVSGGIGYYDLKREFGVRYWAGSLGLAFVHRRLEIDLARYFSDHAVARLYEDASADGEVVLSGVVRF